MAALIAIIDWHRRAPPHDHLVRRLLAAAPHRMTGGARVRAGDHCVFGHGSSTTTSHANAAPAIVRDARTGRWLVADAHLTNGTELADLLELPDAGPAQLLLAGFARWGAQLLPRLRGSYSFVLWDPRLRTLTAARDPFGTRPLFYHRTAERIVFASEVEQLLALPDLSPEVDPRAVLDHLTQSFSSDRHTFFRGIDRVPAGHLAVIGETTLHLERHFLPPAATHRAASAADLRHQLAHLLSRAVASALDDVQPTLIQVSGGIDSSAIAGFAGALARRGELPRTPRLVSAVFPGLPCDESPYIDAVTAASPLPAERYDGSLGAALDQLPCELAHPWRDAQSGTFLGLTRVARAHGARVVLSGFGGDQLFFERGVFRDLAATLRLGQLLRETLRPNYSARHRGYYLFDALKALAPGPLVRAYRALAPTAAAPAWLGPALAPLYHQRMTALRANVSRNDADDLAAVTHTQRMTWRWLTAPAMTWSIEMLEQQAARAGLEWRWPLLDLDIVRLVLSLPHQHRLPNGQAKRLLRDAARAVLPTVVASRRHVTTFEHNLDQHVRHSLPHLRDLFSHGSWRSAPFVDHDAAVRALALDDASLPPATLWNIGSLELWLRATTPATGRVAA